MLESDHAARFEIEARLLSQLKHPRVVEVLDHFQDSNGTYYIEVRTDPARRLYERDTSNDVVLRRIRLGGKPGARTVTVPPYHGIDSDGSMLAIACLQ